MFVSTFSRPRWAMPIAAESSASSSVARCSTVSRSEIRLSEPSRLKRFCPTYFVCRNVSNASAWFSLPRMRICSECVGFAYGRSRFSWNQRRWSGSWMCMYSMPTVRQ